MDSLNLFLGVLGVVLGFISARSTFAQWLASGKSWLSERARRKAEQAALRRQLAHQDPNYLVALVAHDLLLMIAILSLLVLLDPSSSNTSGFNAALSVIRTILMLPAGYIVSFRAGFCIAIVRSKEEARRRGG